MILRGKKHAHMNKHDVENDNIQILLYNKLLILNYLYFYFYLYFYLYLYYFVLIIIFLTYVTMYICIYMYISILLSNISNACSTLFYSKEAKPNNVCLMNKYSY